MPTYYARNVSGNWSATTSWDTVSSGGAGPAGPPVAGDTAIFDSGFTGTITLTGAAACATLTCQAGAAGTLAYGAQTLTVTVGYTIVSTMLVTGTAATGTLALTTAGQTIDSGGVTHPCKLTFNFAGTFTLGGGNNWTVTGLVTISATLVLNKTTAETITCNGGLTVTAASSGTADFILGGSGGTWSGSVSLALSNNLTINCTTLTIGSCAFKTGILTYTAGTITQTSSTLNITGACTLNTGSMTGSNRWRDISFIYMTTGTVTLSSALACTGTMTFKYGATAVTFAGAFGISCGTLKAMGSYASSSLTVTLVAGQTLTVSSAMWISSTDTATITITASSAAYLTYSGAVADCKVFAAIFTNIDASGSAQGIDNWYGGTLTGTVNITNRTSADIGGGGGGGIRLAGHGGLVS